MDGEAAAEHPPHEESTQDKLHHQAGIILRAVAATAPFASENLAVAIHNITANILNSTADQAGNYEQMIVKFLITVQAKMSWHQAALNSHIRHISIPSYNNTNQEYDIDMLSQVFANRLTQQGLDPNTSEVFAAELRRYIWLHKHKAGRCPVVSAAGLIEALGNEEIAQHTTQFDIHRLSGDNFDHTFLVLGKLPDTAREPGCVFSIADLGEECLVIDPWIRCKFLPKDAGKYWPVLTKAGFVNNTTEHGPVEPSDASTYKCHVVLTVPAEDLFIRELMRGFLKNGHFPLLLHKYSYPLSTDIVTHIIKCKADFTANLDSSRDAASRELARTLETPPITNDIDTLVTLIKQVEGTHLFKPLIDALGHDNDTTIMTLTKARTLAHMDAAIAASKTNHANPGRLQELNNCRELFKRAAGLPYDEDAESESEHLITNVTHLLAPPSTPPPGPGLFTTAESSATAATIHQQFVASLKALKSPEPPSTPAP